jgi:hypothetical protein
MQNYKLERVVKTEVNGRGLLRGEGLHWTVVPPKKKNKGYCCNHLPSLTVKPTRHTAYNAMLAEPWAGTYWSSKGGRGGDIN